MKIFLTGGTGYLGNTFLKKLTETDHEVVALYHKQPPEKDRSGISWTQGSLGDIESLKRAMQGCKQVYHMAGLARISDPNKEAFFDINVKGTENILDAAQAVGIDRLVFTSSAAVFSSSIKTPITESDPQLEPFDDDYGATKYLAERKVMDAAKKGFHALIVNPPRIYGPGKDTASSPINKLIFDFVKKSFYFLPGNGKFSGNYAYIDDVLNGHLLAMEKGRPGERYIVGGENYDYVEFYNFLKKITGKKKRSIKVPRGIMDFVAQNAELWSAISGKASKVTPAIVSKIFSNRLLSCEKAIRELGYTITPLEKGIEMTLNSIKSK